MVKRECKECLNLLIKKEVKIVYENNKYYYKFIHFRPFCFEKYICSCGRIIYSNHSEIEENLLRIKKEILSIVD